MDGAFADPGIAVLERAVYRGSIGDDESGEGALEIEPVYGGYEQRIEAVVSGHAPTRAR